MASGNTLLILTPYGNEPPSANFATLDLRNGHPTLDFDTTTQETAIWTAIMPRNYAGGGVTVYLTWAATTATSGTGGWDVSFERIDAGTLDIDADSFAAAQTVALATITLAAGVTIQSNVAVTNGANMDSVAAGEPFRLRIRRDVTNDNATGDLELLAVEIKET